MSVDSAHNNHIRIYTLVYYEGSEVYIKKLIKD